MAQPSQPHRRHHHHHHNKHITSFLQSTASNFISLFNPPPTPPSSTFPQPHSILISLPLLSTSTTESTCPGSVKPVRVTRVRSNGKGGGPAFVGQVFSMCDLSGTGLMAVSTHFDIPFISKRTPEWLKNMFSAITKSERNGPVFRFFIDLGDACYLHKHSIYIIPNHCISGMAVPFEAAIAENRINVIDKSFSYVKKLNIPSGVVGACRLDLAYEHFKEKPHLFQFVPNEKQIKAASKLLKTMPQDGARKKVDGVPVFSAQNLDIAIATKDGIQWYTPYFFDKNMLDNILEESVDQHFHTLIQTRHVHRRRDVIDDNFTSEIIEEMGDSFGDPPEVQEVLDEMGHSSIPLSVIAKAAELQFHYTVDKVLLGNRWLRKAIGIQPKFSYMVDSFERRSEASLLRLSESSSSLDSPKVEDDRKDCECIGSSNYNLDNTNEAIQDSHSNSRQPFGGWFHQLWPKQRHEKVGLSRKDTKDDLKPNPFIPKITMVGISTEESGHMSKASLKKTMDDLTKELEKTDEGNISGGGNDYKVEDRDPLFVANVGDYYSGVTRTGSNSWIRGGTN